MNQQGYSASSASTDGMAGGEGYYQTNDWGESTPFNPYTPSSPFSAGIASPRPSSADVPVNMDVSQLPETMAEPIYTPGYLLTKIGKLMRVEFLVGSNVTDRVGILEEVGASYIVLRALDRGSLMMCDLYAVKFVTIVENRSAQELLAAF